MRLHWQRLIEWLELDRSLVTEHDVDAPREEIKPERPGEEPPNLMSIPSLALLLPSLSAMFTGGTWFMWDYQGAPSGLVPWFTPRDGLIMAYVGMGVFFYWCIRYPLRILMQEEIDAAPQLLRRREEFSSRKSLEHLRKRLGQETQSLGFVRIIFPDHEVKFVELFAGGGYLVIIPVYYEDFGHRTFGIYRHDKARMLPLDRVRIKKFPYERFRREHRFRRFSHHPSFTEDYFELFLDTGTREFRVLLKFRKREFGPEVIDVINSVSSHAAEPRPGDVSAAPAGDLDDDPLLLAWHTPPRPLTYRGR